MLRSSLAASIALVALEGVAHAAHIATRRDAIALLPLRLAAPIADAGGWNGGLAGLSTGFASGIASGVGPLAARFEGAGVEFAGGLGVGWRGFDDGARFDSGASLAASGAISRTEVRLGAVTNTTPEGGFEAVLREFGACALGARSDVFGFVRLPTPLRVGAAPNGAARPALRAPGSGASALGSIDMPAVTAPLPSGAGLGLVGLTGLLLFVCLRRHR